MAHQLLPTLFSPAGQLPTAPGQLTPPRGLSAALLDCSEGSGAALEDWLQAVAGGEGGEEGEEALAADGEDEGEAEQGEVLFSGRVVMQCFQAVLSYSVCRSSRGFAAGAALPPAVICALGGSAAGGSWCSCTCHFAQERTALPA